MQLVLYSWNGNLINDWVFPTTGNFSSFIPVGQRSNLNGQPVYVQRANAFPYLSGSILQPHTFTFKVICRKTIHLQREQLKGWFNIADFTPRRLVAQDIADGNRQWYLTGIVQKIVEESIGIMTVTLSLQEPIWKPVNLSTDTWGITASGQTHVVPTVMGDIPAKPIITIEATTARSGQFAYQVWAPVYNQMDTPFTFYPYDLTQGGISTSALINFTGVSNQINQIGGIGAADVTIPINVPVGGGLPNVGTGYVDTEQISWTSNTGGTSLTGVVRGINGTTAAAHANGAVISFSKMRADGADFVAQVDGGLVDRWLAGINTATTKMWININLSAKQEATLATSISGVGSVSAIQLVVQDSSYNFLYAMQTVNNKIVLIDSEAFSFTGVDLVAYQLTGVTRAQKNTVAAAHTASNTEAVRWIEHDIWVLYGSPNYPGPQVNASKQPQIDLTSTNTSWTWSNFTDPTAARPGGWYGQIISTFGGLSGVFTGNQGAMTKLATEMGMAIRDYQMQNIWKAETASIAWQLNHPAGITTVSVAGSKNTTAAGSWPTVAALQYFVQVTTAYTFYQSQYISAGRRGRRSYTIWYPVTGYTTTSTWTNVWNEAVPATPNTWTAFTHNGVSLGGSYPTIRVILSGSIAAQLNGAAYMQCDTVTCALDSTHTPVGTYGSEFSSYYINCQIKNTRADGQVYSIFVAYPIGLIPATLTIDCEAKTVFASDGANAIQALSFDTIRSTWFDFLNGVNANTLTFTDVGTGNVSISLSWSDRSY